VSAANGPRKPRANRWVGSTIVTLGVIAVALLVLSGSVAANPAALPRSSKAYTAPYTGEESADLFTSETGCGNTISVPVAPDFNLSTGSGVASFSTGSTACGGANSSSSVSALVGLFAPAFTPTSRATYHFTAHWTVSFTVNLTANSGASFGSAIASFFVYGENELYNSNATKFYESTSSPVANVIGSGTYSHQYVDLSFTVTLNETLSPRSHQSWTFATFLNAEISTLASPGSVMGEATMDIASGGNHCTLTSYKVTKS
jgi:hypothetical protein